STAPRPRDRLAALRRNHRRPAGPPAVGEVQRQQRVANLHRHRPQPHPRHRRARRNGPGPREDHPPAPDHHRRQHRPARPHHHPAHARILALAAAVATALERLSRPAGITHPQRRSRRPAATTTVPTTSPSNPATRPDDAPCPRNDSHNYKIKKPRRTYSSVDQGSATNPRLFKA